VAKIETEKLLISLLEQEINKLENKIENKLDAELAEISRTEI
jgi:hypothetical protein